MPLHTERNAPATSDQIDRAEALLGQTLPSALRALYLRHDGLMAYTLDDDPLGDTWPIEPHLCLVGVASANVRMDGLLAHHAESNEVVAYIREFWTSESPPLVFETREFREWAGSLRDLDDPGPGLLDDYLCIAVNNINHESFWIAARADAAIVHRISSPRFSLDAELRAEFEREQWPLEAWLLDAFGDLAASS